jgi:DNA-binding SARP family transcriptional activator
MIRLRTLGACVIDVGGAAVGPDAERLFAVLLYLVTERGRRTARRTIQDLLWPEAGEENGRHNLRQVIYKLRQYGVELGGGNRDVQLYAEQVLHDPFDALSGDAATAGDFLLSGEAGEYLAGYAPGFSEPYAAWVEAQRAYAHARVARCAVGAMLERRARGRWGDVERLAQICLRYDPLNEEATLALAEASALAGSKTRALAILDQYIAELGDSTSIQLPATLLRRRIAERLPDPPYTVPSEACFAGRDESLRYLHELFGHARAGRGQSCMVVGEPGVGKSRLAAEFARVATLQGAQVHRIGCQSRDALRPLALFVDGVPALLKLRGALGCSPRSMAYLKRIIEFDPNAPGPSDDSREAESLYANVRRSVLDLIDAIAAERTLLLVIEDVHWADAASWDILRELIAGCAGRKLLLVLTSRLARVPGGALETLPLRLHHIAPLAPDAARQMLDALLSERQRTLGEAQHAWLLRAANGNPLFLRELAIHWLETGREGEVPPSLAALLRERLGRLTPLALRVFQTCALMGSSASYALLEQVLEYKRHEVLDGLQELEAAGLLRARAGGVESRHELLSEAAVGELAAAARAYLHRQVAVALEPVVTGAGGGDTQTMWACADHWRSAGESDRALQILVACGTHLLEVGLPTQAAEAFERAAEYSTTRQGQRMCQAGLVDALIHGGRWDMAKALLHTITEMDEASGVCDAPAWEAQLRLVEAGAWSGSDLVEVLARASQFSTDRRIPAEIRIRFAVHALRIADFRCSLSEIEATWQTVTELAEHPSVSPITRSTAAMIYHSAAGSLDEALLAAEEVLRAARAGGSASGVLRALRNCAYVQQRCGHKRVALDYLYEAAAIAEAHHLVAYATNTCGIIADYHTRELRLSEAAEWNAQVLKWLAVAPNPILQAGARYSAAKLALFECRTNAAEALLTETVDEINAISDTGRRIECAAVHVHLRLQRGDAELPDALIRSFADMFASTKTLGEQDYPALVWFAMIARADPVRGRAELDAYVNIHRRERGAVSTIVATALSHSSQLQPSFGGLGRSERSLTA